MTISQSDLDNFHCFATNQLASTERDVSLEELVSTWRAQQAVAETLESIRRGVADADAGRTHSVADVDAKIRSELGFPARRQ
jgi:predicted transcriptional regulator